MRPVAATPTASKPAQFAGVPTDLVVVVDVHAGQGQRRVFDDSAQGLAADVAGGPLHHSKVPRHSAGCRLTGTPE